MVVKRQCTFCAGEVEPGTGTMFVKRDGSVFYFCSSSCRKQQLHLGRVGHRLKWTRAHTLKRAQAQTTAQRAAKPSAGLTTPRPSATALTGSAPPPASPTAATPAPATPTGSPAEPAVASAAPAKEPAAAPAKPAKGGAKPRAKSTKGSASAEKS